MTIKTIPERIFSTAFATRKFLFDCKPMIGGSFLSGMEGLKE